MGRWTLKQLLDRRGVRGVVQRVDTSDPPFAVPADVVLDVPVPPSVNRTRKVNPAALGEIEDWHKRADMGLMANGQYRFAKRHPVGDRFDLTIVFDENQSNLDLDNGIKCAIDYLRRLELIRNDDKRYLRGLHIVWGTAPDGCRMVLRGSA